MAAGTCDLTKTLALLEGIKPGAFVPDEVTCFDGAEIDALGRLLGRLVYAPSSLRRRLQQSGVTLTRADFYSEIPTERDLDQSVYPPSRLSLGDMFEDADGLRAHLKSLIPFAAEFDPPRARAQDGVFAWEGGAFSYSDAMSYYATIRKLRPGLILEVGSGASTLVAKMARDRNGFGRIVAVEPYPADYLAALDGVELVRARVQELDTAFFTDLLSDGDILFLDSTHTVKHDSDCLHLYLRVLSAIEASIAVHVHDVYLPGPLPMHMMRQQQIFWTEQYLLAAYMRRNPTTRTLYGSAYHYGTNRALLQNLMHGRYPEGGASFWFTQTRRESASPR